MTDRYSIVLCLGLGLFGCSRNELGNNDPTLAAASPTADAGLADAQAGDPPPAPNPSNPAPGDPGAASGDDAACAVLDAASTLERLPVDIIWVVDDSGSMRDEQERIRENIARFATQVKEAGIDVHVVIVTERDLALNTALAGDPIYRFVQADVGSNNSLEVLLEKFPNYSAQLRPEALAHFVAVTDDESDLAGAAFRTQMETLLGHGFTFHAIASENLNGRACRCPDLTCSAASPGDEYFALADATAGEKVSICTSDFGAVFDRLIAAVVKGSPLPCSFQLPSPPAGATFDPDKVKFEFEGAQGISEIPRLGNADCGPLVAWQYGAAQELVLCPAACQTLGAGGTVHISLGCSPTVVVQ